MLSYHFHRPAQDVSRDGSYDFAFCDQPSPTGFATLQDFSEEGKERRAKSLPSPPSMI